MGKMKKKEAFWNMRAESYDEKVLQTYHIAYKKTYLRSRPFLNPEQRLLDMGCGTGETTLDLAKDVKEVVAFDPSPEMLKHAKKKASQLGITNVSFQLSDMDQFESEAESFDVITVCNVLLYLKNQEEILQKIWNMLKPGGYFLSITDCLGRNLSKDALKKFAKSRLGLMPYVAFDTPAQLVRKVENTGFVILDRANLHKNPPNIFLAAKKPDENIKNF